MSGDKGDGERRKNRGLSDEELHTIKEQLLASIYEDIGRSVVKKALWIIGACVLAGAAWLAAKGYIKL